MKLILGRQNGEENTYLSTKGKLSLLISQTTKEEADLPSPMTCLGLSQKPAANFSARWWPPQNTNPAIGLAENETILLSKLGLGFDTWHVIWSFPSKSPLWQRKLVVCPVAPRAGGLGNFQGRVLPRCWRTSSLALLLCHKPAAAGFVKL